MATVEGVAIDVEGAGVERGAPGERGANAGARDDTTDARLVCSLCGSVSTVGLPLPSARFSRSSNDCICFCCRVTTATVRTRMSARATTHPTITPASTLAVQIPTPAAVESAPDPATGATASATVKADPFHRALTAKTSPKDASAAGVPLLSPKSSASAAAAGPRYVSSVAPPAVKAVCTRRDKSLAAASVSPLPLQRGALREYSSSQPTTLPGPAGNGTGNRGAPRTTRPLLLFTASTRVYTSPRGS
jgi:hypothetical protein